MKRSITSFLAVATLFGTGLAMGAQQDAAAPPNTAAQESQPAQRAPVDPARQAAHLAKKLNLTADQQQQLVPILQNRQQQVEALRGNSSLSKADFHSQMRSLRENTDAQINSLLNDQQKQAYAQMKQQMHERARQKRAEGTPNAA